jgi:hypothetical protein
METKLAAQALEIRAQKDRVASMSTQPQNTKATRSQIIAGILTISASLIVALYLGSMIFTIILGTRK